jgi:hypothetical protein
MSSTDRGRLWALGRSELLVIQTGTGFSAANGRSVVGIATTRGLLTLASWRNAQPRRRVV